MEVDPPEPPSETLTSIAEAQYVRAWGVAFCNDNSLDEITTTYSMGRQWPKSFRITAEGYMETDADLSHETELKESRENNE